jgi:5-methylcytosine-specific restriction protein A
MNNIFWQAPGNGKAFDSFLGNRSKMNSRTLGVLTYIQESSKTTGYVNETQFKRDIKEFLEDRSDEQPNHSLNTHFYKPLFFYGFIMKDRYKNLSLSIEGNLFLEKYIKKEYKQCKELIINQLDNVKYDNSAIPKIKGLKLFPFRILFTLLLQQKTISSSFISNNLVHITKKEDISRYWKSRKLNDIATFDISSSTKYQKFSTWVVNSLVDLNILNNVDNTISIDKNITDHIERLYKDIDIGDMFYDDFTCEVNNNLSKKRTKRDPRLIDEAKSRDEFRCRVDSKHITFVSNHKNYVEGHHLIPMFQQKNYSFNLDNIDNIVSLCPTCHREIHYADDRSSILKKLFDTNKEYILSHDITYLDLQKMYICS